MQMCEKIRGVRVFCSQLCGVLGCACCCGVCVSSCLALKNAPVCTFKKLPNARVLCDTGVLKVHTGAFRRSLPDSPSLPLFSCLFLFSHVSISSHTSPFFCLFSSLFLSFLSVPLSITMTMIARPVSSLCTHGPDLP